MTRTMYDGITPSGLPKGAPLYAGYVDGRFANVPGIRALFPHATVVEIAVSASTDAGQVLDVEQYDASPAEAPGWVQRRRAAGVDPSVYCNSSTWPQVRAAFKAAGVAEPHYWIAQYDGDPTIPAGAVAKQFNDPGDYDISSVADYWPGIDPAPQEDPLSAFTMQDLISAAQQGATAALEDPKVRGMWQHDDAWWGRRVLTGDTSGLDPASAALVLQAHEAIAALIAKPAPAPAPAAPAK